MTNYDIVTGIQSSFPIRKPTMKKDKFINGPAHIMAKDLKRLQKEINIPKFDYLCKMIGISSDPYYNWRRGHVYDIEPKTRAKIRDFFSKKGFKSNYFHETNKPNETPVAAHSSEPSSDLLLSILNSNMPPDAKVNVIRELVS